MKIEPDIKLDFDDVLLKPKRSKLYSRSQVNLNRSLKTKHGIIEGVPIIASNMYVTGTFAMADAFKQHDMFVALHKFYDTDTLTQKFNNYKNAFYTLGIKDHDIQKLKSLSEKITINKICVDVANGYSEYFLDKVKEIRELFPSAIIMAGNVATPEMVQELVIEDVVDIVKVGIGPGKVCSTRMVTGCGYPQLEAISSCADAAHGLGGLICADGGIRNSGDLVKAFAAGADFVMIGNLFAGYEENEGEWEYDWEVIRLEDNTPKFTGKQVKKDLKFYGMSSKEAMELHGNGMETYKASEGICIKKPYKGSINSIVHELLGGLRSGCTYVGAERLKDLNKCATFIRVNRIHD